MHFVTFEFSRVSAKPLLINRFIVEIFTYPFIAITERFKHVFSSLFVNEHSFLLAKHKSQKHIQSSALPDDIDKVERLIDLSLAQFRHVSFVAAHRIGKTQSQRIDHFLEERGTQWLDRAKNLLRVLGFDRSLSFVYKLIAAFISMGRLIIVLEQGLNL